MFLVAVVVHTKIEKNYDKHGNSVTMKSAGRFFVLFSVFTSRLGIAEKTEKYSSYPPANLSYTRQCTLTFFTCKDARVSLPLVATVSNLLDKTFLKFSYTTRPGSQSQPVGLLYLPLESAYMVA